MVKEKFKSVHRNGNKCFELHSNWKQVRLIVTQSRDIPESVVDSVELVIVHFAVGHGKSIGK